MYYILLLIVITIFREACPSRISFGEPTDIENVPYQALIELSNPQKLCGGAIIREDIVLGTHHCAKPNATIYAGSSYIRNGYERNAREVILHPKYNNSGRYDIAVFILKTPLPIPSDYAVLPISMADTFNKLKPGTQALISGWGESYSAESTSPTLLSAYVNILDQNTCATYEKNLHYKSQFCTLNTIYCAASDDLGGPLAYNLKLYGLISKASCTSPISPIVYTNVSYYRKWIVKKVSKYTGSRQFLQL